MARRECWSLTWRGRFLVLGLMAATLTFLVLEAEPFLAPTERVPADLLVIEGWTQPFTMKQAANEFTSGRYQRAILVRTIADLDDKYESGPVRGGLSCGTFLRGCSAGGEYDGADPLVAKKDRGLLLRAGSEKMAGSTRDGREIAGFDDDGRPMRAVHVFYMRRRLETARELESSAWATWHTKEDIGGA